MYRILCRILPVLQYFSLPDAGIKKGLVSIFLVPTSGLILKLPLKRNFCLIIKFEPYLETLPTFFLHAVSENCFFSSSKLTG